MKVKILLIFGSFLFVFFTLSSFKTTNISNDRIINISNQNGLIIYGIYDGKEDYGYNFIVKDKEDIERTVTFHKVEDAVLKTFNLNTETLIGTRFKVTFNRDLKFSKDENGVEDEDETNTIVKLEKW